MSVVANGCKQGRAVALLVWLAAGVLPVHAATRLVYRAESPSALLEGAPSAVVSSAPYDDAPGILSDGRSYFYLVTDGAGQPLPLSIHKNAALDTIRLAFDDGDPGSSPADPALSTVTLSPAAVPADGTTWATVIIDPRDAGGIPLGSGLTVVVDPFGLWPGAVLGAVADLGDGRYRARLVSPAPGSALVRVVVEGSVLAAQPALEFLPVAGTSLKDQAISQLDSLSGPAGIFEALVEGLDPGSSPADKVLAARDDVLDALEALRSGDPSADEGALEDDLKSALDRLEDVLADPSPLAAAEVEALINWVLDAARLLALHWLEQAQAACGPCVSNSPQHVCKAVSELASGDARRAAPDPDYDNAVQDYGKSVEESLKALQQCD